MYRLTFSFFVLHPFVDGWQKQLCEEKNKNFKLKFKSCTRGWAFPDCLFLKVRKPEGCSPPPPESDVQKSHFVWSILTRLTSSTPYPLERMKTFLRSHLGSNLLLPQSGFALINSIMSLFDVELDKTQWEHPPPPRHPASTEQQGELLWVALETTCWGTHGRPISCWPPLILQLLSFLRSPSVSQWPPSRQDIFSQVPAPLTANNLLLNSLSAHKLAMHKELFQGGALTWKRHRHCCTIQHLYLDFCF